MGFGPTNENLLEFREPLEENRNTSAFYSDGKNTTSDVPRYVIYMTDWVSGSLSFWDDVFSRLNSMGVNYIVFGFYDAYNGFFLDAANTWENLHIEEKIEIKQKHQNTRLMLKFNVDVKLISDSIFGGFNIKECVERLVGYTKANLFDESTICFTSYMTFWIKQLWL